MAQVIQMSILRNAADLVTSDDERIRILFPTAPKLYEEVVSACGTSHSRCSHRFCLPFFCGFSFCFVSLSLLSFVAPVPQKLEQFPTVGIIMKRFFVDTGAGPVDEGNTRSASQRMPIADGLGTGYVQRVTVADRTAGAEAEEEAEDASAAERTRALEGVRGDHLSEKEARDIFALNGAGANNHALAVVARPRARVRAWPPRNKMLIRRTHIFFSLYI